MKKFLLALALATMALVFTIAASEATGGKVEVNSEKNTAKILLGPNVAIPGATTLYVEQRKNVLEKHGNERPDAVMDAVVSLSSLMKPSEVDELLENSKVEISAVHYQLPNSDTDGGYEIVGSISESTKRVAQEQRKRAMPFNLQMIRKYKKD